METMAGPPAGGTIWPKRTAWSRPHRHSPQSAPSWPSSQGDRGERGAGHPLVARLDHRVGAEVVPHHRVVPPGDARVVLAEGVEGQRLLRGRVGHGPLEHAHGLPAARPAPDTRRLVVEGQARQARHDRVEEGRRHAVGDLVRVRRARGVRRGEGPGGEPIAHRGEVRHALGAGRGHHRVERRVVRGVADGVRQRGDDGVAQALAERAPRLGLQLDHVVGRDVAGLGHRREALIDAEHAVTRREAAADVVIVVAGVPVVRDADVVLVRGGDVAARGVAIVRDEALLEVRGPLKPPSPGRTKSGETPLIVPSVSTAKLHAAAWRCGTRDSVDQAMSPPRLAKLKFCAPTRKWSCAAAASSTLVAVMRPTKNASSFVTTWPV
ncbi:MAG: hypothetical protein M5U28_23665 [Sandaracinaceae bacterium]|nr:hypothetical protein [Sandaracinaceae bacterium]